MLRPPTLGDMEIRQVQPPLPPGDFVEVPDRGTTWVWRAPGPRDSPTLLLLHGWMATAALNWYPTLESLTSSYGLVAHDQRGHGRGMRDRQTPFTLETCADDAAALIEHLELKNVIAVGYSMGGPVAQLLARKHSDLLDGVVLCATAATFAQLLWLRPAVRLAGYCLSSLASSLGAGAQKQMVRRFARGSASASPIGQWAMDERSPSDPAALLQAGVELNRYDAGSWLGSLDLPVSVIATTQDAKVPFVRQMEMARAIPHSEVFSLDAGHGACIDNAEQFVPLLSQAVEAL